MVRYKILKPERRFSKKEEERDQSPVSGVKGLAPGRAKPCLARSDSGIMGAVSSKEVEEAIERSIAESREALDAAGCPPSLVFGEDGTYRTVTEKPLVGDKIKNAGRAGAHRMNYKRMYFYDGEGLSDDPVSLDDRLNKTTERPPLDSIIDDEDTPITYVPRGGA